MSLSAPTPPLLLTKRLTSFLHANLSPQVHTTLLTTVSGKLLAHASPHPVSLLRTQCTVASSIWSIYAAPGASSNLPDTLPAEAQGAAAAAAARKGSTGSISSSNPPTAVTIQLTGAVLVVRKLKCGLLFVCMGPAPDPSGSGGGEQNAHAAGAGSGAGAHRNTGTQPVQAPLAPQGDVHSSPPLGSPSEVDSVVSAAPTVASTTTVGSVSAGAVVHVRRQAEELARWLDDKLGTLGIPGEGVADIR
ncbi:hypothetical protein BX600DRAFT_511314 [Xylariales sp. PMI_506]|nr:hypothetical protein BX600DRAFT_511314 [Xylariales sp. PMI_506]